MNKWVISSVILLVALLLAGAGIYIAPYWTVSSMRDAARASDGETLSEYVDFPAVRASIKSTINERIEEHADEQTSPLGAFGTRLAGAFADRVVDAMVTPEGLALLLQGVQPGEDPGAGPEANTEMGYEDVNTFAVEVWEPGERDEPVVFLLDRDGLVSWKLTEVRLPATAPEQMSGTAPKPTE